MPEAVPLRDHGLIRPSNPARNSATSARINSTILKRQPMTGSPLLAHAAGGSVHTSSTLWRSRLRSARAASKSVSEGGVGMSSKLSSPTGDLLGRVGRATSPPTDFGGRDSTRRVLGVETAGVERVDNPGSVLVTSPNFAPHFRQIGSLSHNPGLWLLQK